MAPKHSKNDRVKVLATRFDEGSEDRNGDLFSVVHQHNGNGEHCFGNIAHVYSLRSKPIQPQPHRIKCDDGESHAPIEAHVLPGTPVDDGDEDNDASDEPGDLDAANSDADGALNNTITDSDNDEDTHNLAGRAEP